MTTEEKLAQTQAMRSDLQRLIEALDRRVPRLERIGEANIARDAADLRNRALSLMERLDEVLPKD